MTHLRLVILVSGLVAALAQPAAAQDFFDWLNGPPPKKKQDTFKGSVPEPVQRDSLPDVAPAPDAQAPQDDASPYVDRHGEPVPRGPAGEPYGDGAGPPAHAEPARSEQYDPLEARRRAAQPQQPTAAPRAPARSEWQNPDEVAPRRDQRWAPGTYEAEQAMPAAPTSPPRYDGAAVERRNDAADPYVDTGGRLAPPDARQPARGSRDRDPQRSPEAAPVHAANMQDMRAPPGGVGDPWRTLPIAELETMLSGLDLPPRSPVIHELWLRLVTARTSPDAKLAAVRADALNRTGMPREAAEALKQAGDVASDPVMATLAARTAIGAGNTEQGCETARSLTSSVAAKMPPNLKGEVILIAGFCAAAADNKPAAGIAGDLAIENGLQDHAGPAALKAMAAGHKPTIERGKKVSLLDYRILQLAGPVDVSYAIPTASPALLAVLARDDRADPATRLGAAEAAASLNAISIDELAAAYRAHADPRDQVALSDAADNAGQPARRAALFVAAETERTPQKKARVIRAFLDESRRAGFYWTALQLMTRPANDLQPTPEIGWFAETAIESSLVGNDVDGVRRWAEFAATLDTQGRADLRHWLALADIADPAASARSRNLAVVEDLAQRGRIDAALLHRLATTLDALDIQVPMPLWEAASRTEQPSGGHLPDTGVLSQLQDAAKGRDYARTVLLAMRTIGPNGAEGAHMIALGDSIRALKRAGLEAEARRLALEALFAAWPRANNS